MASDREQDPLGFCTSQTFGAELRHPCLRHASLSKMPAGVPGRLPGIFSAGTILYTSLERESITLNSEYDGPSDEQHRH